MRIKQAYISNGVKTFKNQYLKKFDLVEVKDTSSPAVFFGMYTLGDFDCYLHHKGEIIVVWCGSDCLMLDVKKAEIVKSKPATHIVKSKFMSDDLKKHNIEHKILPVTWQEPDLVAVPRGNCIFHYGNGINNFYGDDYLPEIRKRTGLKVIQTTKDTYTREQLIVYYANCFVGLRLTPHDGIPNIVMEMGMMGRRCLYNGYLPNAIPWRNIDDICASIMEEYRLRDINDTEEISKEMKYFIDIGHNWLFV